MRTQPAMLIELSSIPSGADSEIPEGPAARVTAGPGSWTDWLADLEREGLPEALLADGVIARAARGPYVA